MKNVSSLQKSDVILSLPRATGRAKDLVLRFFPRCWRDQNDAPGVFQKPTRGFTLIELVMVILITSVLALAGVHIMKLTIRNSFYLPNQVQADLVAAEALEIIVEGDSQAKGLRFCKAVSIATATQIEVTNQGVLTNLDSQTITYDLTGGILSRKIDTGTATKIPYFMAAE
ncbi:MAG: prepilin-type N-terminal cleavage/methylation domain-containing protein, partial [Candidatus Omnitrophica bacterium]|nr:prepilin-type N-terminal cleavage/methylation domain-containing protein [Candidatus Omnitrophota bacterium]